MKFLGRKNANRKATSFAKRLGAIIICLFVFWSFAYAFTTNVGNYKNGDYRTSQSVASRNDYVYATKSAWWNNADKTEATVRIEIQTKEKKEDTYKTELENADVIIIGDKSTSAYSYLSAYTQIFDFENDIIGSVADRFLSGNFASLNNRVLFMDFSEAVWLYTKNGIINRDGFMYSTYKKASNPDSNYLYRGSKKSNDSLTNMKSRESNLITRYNEIESNLSSQLTSAGYSRTDGLFYSNVSDIRSAIYQAATFNPVGTTNPKTEGEYKYTNIDAPLAMANVILSRRSDTSRKAFVIFLTDGYPDPIGAENQSKGMYHADSGFQNFLDGIKAPYAGYTSEDRYQWKVLKNKYPFNYFYKYASAKLREKAEIYFIKTGDDPAYDSTNNGANGSTIYPIWNYITKGIQTYRTDDTLWPQVPYLPVNYASSKGDNLAGSTSTSTDRIFRVRTTWSRDDAIAAVNEVITSIQSQLEISTTISTIVKDFSCTVTDVINYNDFEIVSNSWNSNINKRSISYNSSNKTISWPISGIKYGAKASDGNWPYIEFKIKLKDNSKSGQINTNFINNIFQYNDDDTSCKITNTPEPANENFTVPSPWLNREPVISKGNIRVNYLEVGTYRSLQTSESNSNIDFGTYTKNAATISGYVYAGYEIVNGIVTNVTSGGPTNTSSSASVTINATTPDKTVNFYYSLPEVKGSITVNYLEVGTYRKLKDSVTDSNLSLGTYSRSAAAISGYNYSGYDIVNGVVTNVTSGSPRYSSSTASVTLDSTNPHKTVNFYYSLPEVKGSITVNYLEVGSYRKLKDSSVDSNLTLGTYSRSSASISGYVYSGYEIVNGSITNVTSGSPNRSGTTASVTIDSTNPHKTVNFYYSLPEVKGSITINYLEVGTYRKLKDSTKEDNLSVGTYKRNAPSINKYNYAGYDVVNGSITNVTSGGPTNPSSVASVTLTSADPDKTVNFYYAEKTGSVKVRYVKIVGINNASEIPEYTKVVSVPLGEHTENKEHDLPNCTYLGYDIQEGLVASTLYSINDRYTQGTKAKVTVTEAKPNWIITFVFKDTSIRSLGVGIEFKHYDRINREYINPGDTINRTYNDLSKLVEKLYAGNESKLAEYNQIATGSGTKSEKVSKVLELISDKWNGSDFPALKSLYTENEVLKKYHYINNETTLKSNRSSENKLAEQAVNSVQYIPTHSSVKSYVDSKAVLSNSTDDMLTITMYYNCDNVVNVKCLDGNQKPNKVSIESGRYDYDIVVPYNGRADIRIPGIAGWNYGDQEGAKQSGGNLYVENVTSAKTVYLYYYRGRNVRVRHLDIDDKTISVARLAGKPDPEQVSVPQGTTRDVYAISGQLKENSNYYYLFCEVNDVDGVEHRGAGSNKVSITSTASNYLTDSKINFYYKKYWQVVVRYKDEDDPHGPDIHDPLTGYEPQGSSITRTKIDIEHYTYTGVEGPGVPKNPSESITIDPVTGVINIIFWYHKQPTIDPDLIPEDDGYVLGDPTDPQNPFTADASDETKILVLDDLFTINMKVDNYNYAEDGYYIGIQLPFDVYCADSTDETPKYGRFVKANAKIVVDEFDEVITGEEANFSYKFRLPSWVIEKPYGNSAKVGIYDSSDRIIDEKIIAIRVIGRLYDYTITNLEGDEFWRTSLFLGSNSGIEYKADTLPIGQRAVTTKYSTLPDNPNTTLITSPSVYRYGIKLGSTFLFSINTKGLVSDQIRITPRIVYYDANGNKDNSVTFVYNVENMGRVNFAASNGFVSNDSYNATGKNFETKLSKQNRNNDEVKLEIAKAKYLKNTSIYNPDIKPTGFTRTDYASNISIKNAYLNFNDDLSRNFGSFKELILPNTLRTPYANYASSAANLLKYAEVQRIGAARKVPKNGALVDRPEELKYIKTNNSEYYTNVRDINIFEDQVINSLGHWYAEYRLPSTLTVLKNGKELKEGYIVVEFRIASYGLGDDGKYHKYLSYASQNTTSGNNFSQWLIENGRANNLLSINFPATPSHQNGITKTITTSDGFYPVAIYDASVSLNNNFEVVGTH